MTDISVQIERFCKKTGCSEAQVYNDIQGLSLITVKKGNDPCGFYVFGRIDYPNSVPAIVHLYSEDEEGLQAMIEDARQRLGNKVVFSTRRNPEAFIRLLEHHGLSAKLVKYIIEVQDGEKVH